MEERVLEGSCRRMIPKRRFIKRILLGTLKAVLCILIVLFGFVPVLFRYTYPLQRTVIFLSFVKWPRAEDLKTPEKLGMVATRNFYVTTDEGVTLGTWHVLPMSLSNSSFKADEYFYEEALSRGEPIILYMHGNSGSRGSAHRLELYKMLQDLNCHVIAFDYRSYGDSTPVSPTEIGVVSDGKYMFNWIEKRANGAQIYVWGHSLGTGCTNHYHGLSSSLWIQWERMNCFLRLTDISQQYTLLCSFCTPRMMPLFLSSWERGCIQLLLLYAQRMLVQQNSFPLQLSTSMVINSSVELQNYQI